MLKASTALRLFVSLFLAQFVAVSSAATRESIPLVKGWVFTLGDRPGAEAPSFDVRDWKQVLVPHDWSIALPRSEDAPDAGNAGFFTHGIGWYRHTFIAPPSWQDRAVLLELEGAYMKAEVWINGKSIGRQNYGYTPLYLDLTPHLRIREINTLAIRVDNSAQPNSRWYSGSGLYRPATLHVTAPVRVAPDGIWVRTLKLDGNRAELQVDTTLLSPEKAAGDLQVEHQVYSPEGRLLATRKIKSTSANSFSQALAVSGIHAWSPTDPRLYKLVTRVRAGGRLLDETSTPFGIRTVRVTAERGFELNGIPIELNGGNVHHDTGILGAASLPAAEERKVRLLKEAGFNAVRTAHNPPSRAFLEACDRLGLLVLDELFDGWAKAKTKHDYSVHFAADWTHDLDTWIRRDRNHPSVIAWSVGNEMFERGGSSGLRIARELTERIKLLDTTRPVTAGVNGLGKGGNWEKLDPLFATFDLAGYNYELAHHATDHARLPQRIIFASESYQSEVFAVWKASQDHPYFVGDFVWSALDYLGESGIGRVYTADETPHKHWEAKMWPWFGAYCGDIDLTGWRKPVSHYRSIVWKTGESLYAAVLAPTPDGRPWNVTPWSMPPALPTWTWPDHEGKPLTVEVYSRWPRVRLELNGRTVGEADTGLTQEFRASFSVPYTAGTLTALGLDAQGKVRERFVLPTAGPVAKLRATLDRDRLRNDGLDVVYLTLEAVDKHGTVHPFAPVEATIEVEGAGFLAGFGTGDLTTDQNYFSATWKLHQGRALAAIRSNQKTGRTVVTVRSLGLPDLKLRLRTQR